MSKSENIPTTPAECRAAQERVLTAEQTEMLYQIQGCAEVGDGHYHDAVTDGLILALAGAHAEALERVAALRAALDLEERLADALAQGDLMRQRHKAAGRHHVITALRAILPAPPAPASAEGGAE